MFSSPNHICGTVRSQKMLAEHRNTQMFSHAPALTPTNGDRNTHTHTETHRYIETNTHAYTQKRKHAYTDMY